MIYVYALTDATTTTTTDAGIDDRPVSLHTCGDVAAACTVHAQKQIPITPQNVWRHQQVIEQLMAAATVLPACFGTSFDCEEALDAVLHRNKELLAQSLANLRGKVEMGLRVLREPPADAPEAHAPTTTTTGRDYMTRRAADHRRRESLSSLATAIHARIAPHAADHRHHILPSPQTLLTAAYLIAREEILQFAHRVRVLAADYPVLQILGTGPWPAYHFAPTLQ